MCEVYCYHLRTLTPTQFLMEAHRCRSVTSWRKKAATWQPLGRRIGALVVVDETGKVVGLLSERDIIREAAQNEALFSQLVSSIMTKDVIVARPGDDLHA